MKGIRIFLVLILVFASTWSISAQESADSLLTKTNVKPFVTLYHQHHDFFGKAFSFQGIEGGVIVQRNLYMGVYVQKQVPLTIFRQLRSTFSGRC